MPLSLSVDKEERSFCLQTFALVFVFHVLNDLGTCKYFCRVFTIDSGFFSLSCSMPFTSTIYRALGGRLIWLRLYLVRTLCALFGIKLVLRRSADVLPHRLSKFRTNHYSSLTVYVTYFVLRLKYM